ncbi:MAG: hypothetical protein HKN36_02230 [Hellea sp.]|nr:hypothetical protein [Hellea sp.]
MSRRYRDDWDRTFEDEYAAQSRGDDWSTKGARFVRYLSTRKIECWGFFAAGFFISKIFF